MDTAIVLPDGRCEGMLHRAGARQNRVHAEFGRLWFQAMKAAKPHRDSKLAVDEMTDRQAQREHARLEAEIRKHDEAYYQKDAPTVSDADYDALRQRYNAIEARFPDLRTLESLSRKVGAAPAARLRQGAARGADAVARQRVQRRGRRPISSPASGAS